MLTLYQWYSVLEECSAQLVNRVTGLQLRKIMSAHMQALFYGRLKSSISGGSLFIFIVVTALFKDMKVFLWCVKLVGNVNKRLFFICNFCNCRSKKSTRCARGSVCSVTVACVNFVTKELRVSQRTEFTCRTIILGSGKQASWSVGNEGLSVFGLWSYVPNCEGFVWQRLNTSASSEPTWVLPVHILLGFFVIALASPFLVLKFSFEKSVIRLAAEFSLVRRQSDLFVGRVTNALLSHVCPRG